MPVNAGFGKLQNTTRAMRYATPLFPNTPTGRGYDGSPFLDMLSPLGETTRNCDRIRTTMWVMGPLQFAGNCVYWTTEGGEWKMMVNQGAIIQRYETAELLFLEKESW